MGVLEKNTEHWFAFDCKGKTYHLPKACPHRGGRLDLGFLNSEKGLVVCPLHKSTFCIPNGKLVSGPASAGLKVSVCQPEEESPGLQTKRSSKSVKGT